MKIKISLAIIVIGYAFLHIATKPAPTPNPCRDRVYDYIYADFFLRDRSTIIFTDNGPKDTVFLILRDSTGNRNFSLIADSICVIRKNNCTNNRSNVVLVTNSQTPDINWNTKYGKIMIEKNCP